MSLSASNGADTGPLSGELTVDPPKDIILPPMVIRGNIIKTADFIYRRGKEVLEVDLKKRMRDDQTTSRLNFLDPNDPYNKYYRWHLQMLREGKGRTRDSRVAQAARDNKPKGPPEPPRFRFSARMPNISAKDLEILKLTALYTARVGENWLKDLRNRQSGNPQFDFLRPNHSFFQYLRALIEQYKILLEEEQTVEARIEEVQHNITDRFHILERARQRAEYIKFVTEQKEQEEKKAEDEKKEYASIDWYDFGIIATVVFDEADDGIELPAPTSLNDLQSASLEQKATVSLGRRLEEAMPDEDTYYNTSQQYPHMPPPMYPPMAAGMAPPVRLPFQPQSRNPYDYKTPAQRAAEEEAAARAREQQAERDRAAQAQAAARAAPGSMRIRTDYTRTAVKKTNVATAVCPNCKQHIPTDEMDEHLRIELLDPRWKEQRDKTDARYSTTINTADVANNLKRFASQRDDIYDGVTGLPISEEELLRRKKAATSYDGQPDPAKDAVRLQQMQTMNVQEQLRRIQERHGGNQ
ncbi:Pre-mRNA splicing factor PRP21 like protein-domain-containing protein [Massariosphaeria phaeospora]|uniref:Pre-mRNA splicing factor PRP21 like protein-domain-containing protein n=1 Tax=Massariosphaeria phaeospora TaxID=100035 RepID=A0A7C8IHW5_9PLEO|nr:Pre-mRNA splicing factor PRP21 like protein-domain-containing protein [Massariosphaeria phaeospora]